jgi:CheY-like chemotaxis protein
MVCEDNPQARTIVITGHRTETDRLIEQMVAERADAVCYKPFNVPVLLAKLRELAAANEEGAGHPPR